MSLLHKFTYRMGIYCIRIYIYIYIYIYTYTTYVYVRMHVVYVHTYVRTYVGGVSEVSRSVYMVEVIIAAT